MKETIVAQATAPGRGGIGILRVSGPKALEVAQAVLGKCPKPRMADYLPFKDADGTVLDQGIALYFKSPNSFTGEDVLELQGHGGQVAGLHLVDHLGGGQDMLLPVPVLAGEAHDDDGPQVKAGGHQFLPRLQHLSGGNTLVDGL